MGGGPRTFPGGLNKWQYKRMHEKLAKEKERKLLHQEKQLYQARLRSEIRAKAAGGQSPQSNPSSEFGPMSSKDHIKALADRFMKEGAEDLWNEDDGPISTEKRPPPKLEGKPLDLKKIVKDARSSVAKLGSFQQKREYSKWRRNSSSEDEDEELDGGDLLRKELKISRFGIGMEEEEEERGFGVGRKKMMSGAALGNFDRKKERRRLRGAEDEEESDLLEQIRGIHEDIKKRESFENGVKGKGESVLTQKS